ncbi:MAG TPA: YfdX family protein [Gammaproteobacteria bacterium]|nr:YfdX family protein [Gammaproteobacteria bacterium]
MKIKSIVNSLLIGSLLLVAPYTQAASTITEKGKNKMTEEQTTSSDKAINSLKKEQNELLNTVHEGVLDGYRYVVKATRLLTKDNKEKEAIKLLQEATGKFDVALAADPALNLVPINADVSISALITTVDLVKAETDVAIDLLKDHKIQAAREIIGPMKDEMIISHAYLPMGTYPDAIKLATKYLVNNKKEDALTTLATALSTIVVEKAIVPLAFVRAEDLLKTASKLDKNKDKARAQELLSAAQEQLEIANLLGYFDKKSKAYESIKAQIKSVKKEIDGKNVVENLYDKVKSSIKGIIDQSKEAAK